MARELQLDARYSPQHRLLALEVLGGEDAEPPQPLDQLAALASREGSTGLVDQRDHAAVVGVQLGDADLEGARPGQLAGQLVVDVGLGSHDRWASRLQSGGSVQPMRGWLPAS